MFTLKLSDGTKGFGEAAIATHTTIVIADLEETGESVKRFYSQGFRAFKVKIGRDEDLDIKRVLAVKRLAPRSAIYLDANQGYMETSLAMTASAHLASGLGGFEFIDLDTPFFIKPGFDQNPYLSRRGIYDLRKVKVGIGILPVISPKSS